MVHLAIDGMWQVFKLQRSTPRNDFCRIAAKNGILPRLINTLYSLNEAARLASIAAGSGFAIEGLAPRPRSGSLDPSSPIFIQGEASLTGSDHTDLLKVRHGVGDHSLPTATQEPSRVLASNTQRSDGNQPDSRYFSLDNDRPAMEASVASKLQDLAFSEKVANVQTKESPGPILKERENLDCWKIDPQRVPNSANRTSVDRPSKLVEGMPYGFPTTMGAQQEQVRPLLSLLDKEPPSRHFSGQLEYVRHLSGLEKHESILPLLHATNEKRTNGELDFLMAEFAGN